MIYKKREIYFVIFITLILLSISVHAPVEIVDIKEREISVKCQSTVGNVGSVKAKVIGGSECAKVSGWLYESLTNKIKYKCTVPVGQRVTIECYVDESISYTRSSPKSASAEPCVAGNDCTTGGCAGTFDANCNCVDTPNDGCPLECIPGEYGSLCKKCGGVKFCGTKIYYCGVGDNICPAKYGASCDNHRDCTDVDCNGKDNPREW